MYAYFIKKKLTNGHVSSHENSCIWKREIRKVGGDEQRSSCINVEEGQDKGTRPTLASHITHQLYILNDLFVHQEIRVSLSHIVVLWKKCVRSMCLGEKWVWKPCFCVVPLKNAFISFLNKLSVVRIVGFYLSIITW